MARMCSFNSETAAVEIKSNYVYNSGQTNNAYDPFDVCNWTSGETKYGAGLYIWFWVLCCLNKLTRN